MTALSATLLKFQSLQTRLAGVFSGALSGTLNVALPLNCCLCQAPGKAWCDRCLSGLQGLETVRCTGCGLGRGCDCKNHQNNQSGLWLIDRTLVLADYVAPIDRLIADMKFQGKLHLAKALGLQLGKLLETVLQHEGNVDARSCLPVLIPVPLSSTRLRERGFNQTQGIAKAMKSGRTAFAIKTPKSFQLLRTTQKRAQSTLGREARLENLELAYQVKGSPPDWVILVDDVMTTGATLNACATVLRAAGTREIWAIVAARTPRL
jgi:ComF family protein